MSTSEGKQQHFTGGYERRVIPGVGHFPTREASETVGAWAAEFLKSG